MAKKKSVTKHSKKDLLVTYIWWNPDAEWGQAKPPLQRLYENNGHTFDPSADLAAFNKQKKAVAEAKYAREIAQKLKAVFEPMMEQAKAILAEDKAKKAAKKKSPPK